MAETVEVLVDGGAASAGPPLGPAMGPLGVNVMQVVQEINKKTADFKGMKVPVKVVVDTKTKSFEVTVGTPPASALLMQELGISKGSGDARGVKVANATTDQIVKVARMKQDALMGSDLAAKSREIAGVCVSMGITIEGLDAREWQRKCRAGEYADQIKDE